MVCMRYFSKVSILPTEAGEDTAEELSCVLLSTEALRCVFGEVTFKLTDAVVDQQLQGKIAVFVNRERRPRLLFPVAKALMKAR